MIRALAIAGSDSGGGAGVQADLKTFSAFGVHGSTAITAITAQNTSGVDGIFPVPPDMIRKQLSSIIEDLRPASVKTGMLPTPEILETVSLCISDYNLRNVVVDPVMVAQSGDPLTTGEITLTLKNELIPLCTLITPNVPEAEALSGKEILGPGDMGDAARAIHDMGARNVLIKGGHFIGEDAGCDLLFNGIETTLLRSVRKLAIRDVHGTGCALSAAIAACLARGLSVRDSVETAKEFITRAIETSYSPGSGARVVNPLELDDRGE